MKKSTRSVLITVFLLCLTPVLVYFASSAAQNFDFRSLASAPNPENKCSLLSTEQSTLSEYAQKRGINIGATLHECFTPGRPAEDVEKCKQTILKEYSGMILNAQDSWAASEKIRGTYDYTHLDTMLNFARQNNLKIHFFHLIWINNRTDGTGFPPKWLFSSEQCGTWTRDQLLEIMKKRIQDNINYTKDVVVAWNVVNEAFGSTGMVKNCFYKIVGEDYIDKAFQYAREATPTGTLVLNDAFGPYMENKVEIDKFFAYVKSAKARGIPIDAVGVQNHARSTKGEQFTQEYINNLKYFFKKANDTNVKVLITEMDVYQGKEPAHTQIEVASVYRKVAEICLENSNCISLSTWGISDKYSWLRNDRVKLPDANPLLFDESYARKPAYNSVMQALRENSTRGCFVKPVEVTYSTINNVNLKLDICSPINTTAKMPTVVFIHGGGFTSGDKSSGTNQYCQYFTQNGYIFISVDYRLSSVSKYPGGFDDVQYAIRWIRANAEKYNIDTSRMAAMGSSAGATFASLLGVRDTRDSTRGLSQYSSKVDAVISISGVQDFNSTLGSWKPFAYFENDKEKIKDASTVTHLTKDDAPFLLIHGNADKIVPSSQSTSFGKKLKDLGIYYQVISHEGAHGFTNVTSEKISEIKSQMIDFLNKTLNTTPTPPPPPPTPTLTPNINTSVWDNFKGGNLNKKRWEVYYNTPSVKVMEDERDNLTISTVKGIHNSSPKSGGIQFKTTIPKNSDFRVITSIYKPSITQSEGEINGGILFNPSESNEENDIKVFWRIDSNSTNQIVMTYKNKEGKVIELGKVDINEKVTKVQLRLIRVKNTYIAKYKLTSDDDESLITIGQTSDIKSAKEGIVKIFASNVGKSSDFPGYKVRIDTTSVAWYDKNFSKRDVLNDNFSGLTVNTKNWTISTGKGTAISIGVGRNLIESITAGSNDGKAKIASITTKDVITQGKSFVVDTYILKPIVSGEGIGKAGVEYITSDTANLEKVSVVWSIGADTSQLIYLVQDSEGNIKVNKGVALAKDTSKILVRIKRDEDGYSATYKEKIGDDEPSKSLNEKILLQNLKDGQIRLFTTNVGYKEKFPSVKGRFDAFHLYYSQ